MPAVPCLTPQAFTNYILTQLPVYQDEIIRDIRGVDDLAAHVDKGEWDPFAGVQQTQDRFLNVKANTAKKWHDVGEASCSTDGPCDPIENQIGWGTQRIVYGQQRQSWKSQLICFDQVISATKAVEHFQQIISDILMPATKEVSSAWVRRQSLALAGKKIVADATMTDFTGSWSTVGDEEIIYTPSVFPTSKLTPEMIKRQIPYLRDVGYFGRWTNDPFWGGYDNFAELITDDDTCWELDKIADNQRLSDQWRFQMWSAAHEYYQYGMGGQIGNYMTHVDPNCLRFNKKGSTLIYVPKYINGSSITLPQGGTATQGIGSAPNPDWYKAQYQISFIWHRFAWQMLVQQLQAINPLMPFLVRGLNGQWYFAIDNLGADCEGNPIANYRRNKGFFWADFRYGARPRNNEWLVALLHLREPTPIYVVPPCAADPGYPTQSYTSENATCDTTYRWIPDQAEGGHYKLSANSTTCDDAPLDNGAIDAASLSALVTDLQADSALGAIGTWSQDGTYLIATGVTCGEPILPWLAS